MENALINDGLGIIMVILAVPALLFTLSQYSWAKKLFSYIPLLVFAYFIPTLLSTLDIIPASAPVYKTIKYTVLPASLLLFTLSIDLKAISKLGPKALICFFAGTAGVVVGGPLSLYLFKDQLPPEIWKGMSALAGSWIGGGANMVAVGDSVGATESMFGMMVVVDVAVANVWTGLLMYFAGNYKKIDAKLGADNSAVEQVKESIMDFQAKTARVSTTKDFMVLFAVAFGGAWIATKLGKALPELGTVVSHGTWKIILITTFGLILSFTPFKKMEGAGASKLGSVMLYMLIGVIGASADVTEMIKYPYLIAMGFTWISVHILFITIAMKLTKAPIFFLAVGSQANVGGAASAPIVASAFHPSLAPVGILLGVLGYIMGTYAAFLCAGLLSWVAGM